MKVRLRRIIIILISILFTICFFVGRVFDRNYHLMRDHWFIPKVLLVFVITCMIFAVFYKEFDIYFSKEMKDHIAGKALFDQKNGKIAWLIIMLVWIPNYISYLPGVFTVDAINQIEQFASHNLTNHHPILTTFIEAPIVLLGKHMGYLGIGLAIYLLLIFILSSYIISRGFAWMSKHHTPYAIRTIMLDIGHGGKDRGAAGRSSLEKNITLRLGRRLGAILGACGYRVILTRNSDVYLDLDKRSALQRKYGADLFLSLHINSAADRSVKGVETFCLTPAGAPSSNGGKTIWTKYNGNAFDSNNIVLAFSARFLRGPVRPTAASSGPDSPCCATFAVPAR